MGIPDDIANLNADLTTAEDNIDALLARIDHLEAQVARNDQRLLVQEAFMADHREGAQRRQAEVDSLRADNQRLRYTQRTGRQP